MDKGEIKETFKNQQIGAENNNNTNKNNDELFNKSLIYNNNNNSEINSLKNKEIVEKKSIIKSNILNKIEKKIQSNIFNFDKNIFMKNSNENRDNINNDKNNNKNQMFTFENELQN